MKTSLDTRLKNHISFGMSRSAWIANAIEAKLDRDGEGDVDHWTTDELLQELAYGRFKDNKPMMKQIQFIRDQLETSNQN
tara:strand:+ start:513 stop:752 length:240 start_codon:yes stop_codon:yes gene_type:complete